LRINILKKATIFRFCLLFCISVLMLTIVPAALTTIYAQSDIRGLFQNYNALQTTPDYEFVAARNRFRVQYERSLGTGPFYTEIDLVQRYADSESVDIIIRELYLDWYFNNSDLRIGKQKITWGRATGAFVTDILSPVDLREFLTQDPSDLILGVTAVNYTRYFGNNSLQVIFNPVFQQDQLPSSGSRWFPIQTFESPIQLNFNGNQRSPSVRNMQLAARYALRSTDNFDLDLKLMHWTHPMPAYAITINLFNFFNPPSVELTETYLASLMGGYSLGWQIHSNWSFQTEALFVKDRLFTFLPVSVSRLEAALDDTAEALLVLQDFEIRDDGYLLQKPWLHTMVGVQTEISGTTLNVQAYLETIFDYEERILPQRLFPYVTALLNRSILRDRLQLTSLARYNFFGEDIWFQLQGVYELSDGIELAMGTNLFGGEEISPFYGHFTFYQFKENSFIFSRFSLYF
jgi:hypothetical protein